METKYNQNSIGGFVFSDVSDYERAKKEYETVQNIKNKLKTGSVDEMETLYYKAISGRYFITPIGITFLSELRRYIIEEKKYGENDLSDIIIPRKKSDSIFSSEIRNIEELKKENERLKTYKMRITVIVVALALTVVGMFIIVLTSDNYGYMNTEEKIIDKYSAWEEDLEQREEALILKENKSSN